MGGKLGTPFERFQTKFRVCKKTGCWLWTAGLNDKGYGTFYFPPQNMVGAHVASWRLHCGETGGLHVLHECDTPRCVNPHHLYLGTHQDNMRDRDRRGRFQNGEGHGNTVLTRAQVLEIRRDNRVQHVIAKEYGVTQGTVSNIKIGKTWGHV